MGQHTTHRVVTLPREGNAEHAPERSAAERMHSSRFWLPSEVARRLCDRHGGDVAGLRALQHRERQIVGNAGDRDVLDPFRWIYWDTVLIAIERRTRLQLRGAAVPLPRRSRYVA